MHFLTHEPCESDFDTGKTWTARRIARSEVLLDVDDEARKLARLEPAGLLAGRTPRLIVDGYAYTRPDGVAVIPVGALGP